MRVLLCYKCSEDGGSDFFERILPVGLCSLAAVLRAHGHDVTLANLSGGSWRAAESLLRLRRPDLIGISTFTFNRHASLRLARAARRVVPRATVVLGGPHASHVHRAILAGHPEVDFVVLGEGEDTLTRLTDALESGADATRIRGLAFRRDGEPESTGWPEPIGDLDRVPIAAKGFDGHGVNARDQLMYLITSRGCPARCTFCNTPEFWGTRIRFRSVDHVLEEMRTLRNEWGLLYLSIRDDTFTAHRKRVLELCRRMEEERLFFLWDCQSRVNAVDDERLVAMRRAGCVHVQYGVESGSPRMLEVLNKDIRTDQIEEASRATRHAGLVFSVYLIAGAAGESAQDVRDTEELLLRVRPHDAMVSPLAVFPGTALWDEWRSRRGLDDSYWDEGTRDDVYVRAGDPSVERATARIGRVMERIARRSAYTLAEYGEQRRRIGDCHALDLALADLHRIENRPHDAEAVLTALVTREPDDPWAHLRLGQLRLELRRNAEAAARFRELVRLVPRFPEGHALLGAALERTGRSSASAESYATALRLDPRHAAASRALRRLGVVEASAKLAARPRRRDALVRN